MRQNYFAAIGRRTSEISCQKNETAVKHKAFPNYRSGRPKRCNLMFQSNRKYGMNATRAPCTSQDGRGRKKTNCLFCDYMYIQHLRKFAFFECSPALVNVIIRRKCLLIAGLQRKRFRLFLHISVVCLTVCRLSHSRYLLKAFNGFGCRAGVVHLCIANLVPILSIILENQATKMLHG